MGTYRLLLAIAVALSHMRVRFLDEHNPGVVAVISFFLISGFVMTGLVRTYYTEYRKVPLFYLDRMARIFPQYLFFLALTAGSHYLLGFTSPFLGEASIIGVLANLLVVPLDLYMFSGSIAGYTYIPQAWSLGLELMFYLSFPLIMISHARVPVFVASVLFWMVAAFGMVDPDVWGYRLLPGTLFIFLLGSFIYDNRKPALRHPAVILFVVLAGCAIALRVLGKLDAPFKLDAAGNLDAVYFTWEVLLGMLIGIPMLFALAHCARGRWDDWLGNLSYGVFLCHFLVIWLFQSFGIEHDMLGKAMMIALSMMLAYVGFVLVEYPMLLWRHHQRKANR